MHDINNFLINKEYIADIHNNNVYNKTIADYYGILHKEFDILKDENLIITSKYGSYNYNLNFKRNNKYFLSDSREGRLLACNSIWFLDRYDYNQIKDFKSTNLCKDKFCSNCKKVKQASRMSRYIPFLEPYKDNLYHLILTVPNVSSVDLKSTLDIMTKSFRKLILYLNGNINVKYLNFSKYSYLGAVRSLEITFNEDSYHPHFHVAIAFDNLDLLKNITNTYSYDRSSDNVRLFSEFEVLIQKIWYLLINKETITHENISKVDLGYSCAIDKFKENDYAELFKYMTKSTNEDNNLLSYDNFKSIYLSTHKRKQIQGYGVFYRINDEDIEEEIDKIYADIQEFLSREETPVPSTESPIDLLHDDNYQIISRRKIYQYLKEIK